MPTQLTPQVPVTFQALRLSGPDALAVRASKKLRSDELLVLSLAPSSLKLELDRIPLWRGNHVAIRQLIEDFGRYPYLPRLRSVTVLLDAIQAGLNSTTWELDSFAYAEGYDEADGRYRGLRAATIVTLSDADGGLIVKPESAKRQLDAEAAARHQHEVKGRGGSDTTLPVVDIVPPATTELPGGGGGSGDTDPLRPLVSSRKLRRFHGSVTLSAERAGLDASKIAEEVIAHLVGQLGANVRVTLELEADIPDGAPEKLVRTVTENSRTLKFTQAGFEAE